LPLDGHRTVTRDVKPTNAEVDSQVERLCAHPLLHGDKRVDLLKFLIRIQHEGRFREPFSERKPRPSGKSILFEFYEEWAAKTRSSGPQEIETAGKRLIGDLRKALKAYYGRTKDPVVISIPAGRQYAYEPAIRYRVSKVLKSQEKPTPATTDAAVACEYLGNDREAMRYVLDRYAATSSPRLVGLRDTHVRAELPMRYRENYYRELQAAFSDFLRRSDPETTVSTLICGWEVDKQYMRMVQAAADGQGDKLKCYRLRHPAPVMNFILMDYDDLTSEVLFGWGQGKPGHPGSVFRSKDRRLVEEFNDFYETLLQSADQVPLASLLETPPSAKRLP
jgi:hypothetical protein